MSLPERVPRHFGLDGQVTAVTSRTAYLVGAALLVTATIAGVLWCVRLARRGGVERLDVPDGDHGKRPDDVDRSRRAAEDDVLVIGSATAVLLAALGVAFVDVADDPQPSLPLWWGVTFAGYLVGVVGWAWYATRRRARPETD